MARHRKKFGSLLFVNPIRKWIDYFMNDPQVPCPKCGSEDVEWYDPFFFAPMRALKFQRRMRCHECRYVWRPQHRRMIINPGDVDLS